MFYESLSAIIEASVLDMLDYCVRDRLSNKLKPVL